MPRYSNYGSTPLGELQDLDAVLEYLCSSSHGKY